MNAVPESREVPRETKIAQVVFTILFGFCLFPYTLFVALGSKLKEATLAKGIGSFLVGGDYLFSSWGKLLPYGSDLLFLAAAFLIPIAVLALSALARGERLGAWEEGLAWLVCGFSALPGLLRFQGLSTGKLFPSVSFWAALFTAALISLALLAFIVARHRVWTGEWKARVTIGEQMLLGAAVVLWIPLFIPALAWILRGEILIQMMTASRDPERKKRLRDRAWQLLPNDRTIAVLTLLEERERQATA